MPVSPIREPRPITGIAEAADAIRAAGGRVSTARRAILTSLIKSSAPRSAEQIAQDAVPRLDVAATYRNLEYLESIGLVRHVHLGHGPGLYELESTTEHEYGLCDVCGTRLSLDPSILDAARAAIDQAIGLQVSFTHFPLVGICRDCRA